MMLDVFRKVLGKDFGYLKPYVVAEIGVNHEGSVACALDLIDGAAASGCDAAKFQTYKAELLAAEHSPAYWDASKEATTSQFQLFKKYDSFGEAEYKQLAAHCADRGIDFMSTPFDFAAVDTLNPLVRVFKIASADITNIPLLRKVARTAKPVVLSTGASTLSEIQSALDILLDNGCTGVALLHCVLNYPTSELDANLGVIRTLARTFPDCPVGYSDHVPPDSQGRMRAVELATVLGAVIIEKHFTYDKSSPGNDHYHAMTKEDATNLRIEIGRLSKLFGNERKNIDNEMSARLHARRGIYARHDISVGNIIREDDIIPKRPSAGIGAEHWDSVVGRKAAQNISAGQAVHWSSLAPGANNTD